MIGYTGNDLQILIECEYKLSHHWMAFAAWYSFYKNLPDAQVVMVSKHGLTTHNLYRWVYKVGAKLHYYSKEYDELKLFPIVKNLIKIKPSVMAIRPVEEGRPFGPLSVKSAELPTLVDYSDGCGLFVVSDWIDRVDGPFQSAMQRFLTNELTANELKVLRLWTQMVTVFSEAKT